jgi:hypothetical protein
VRFPNQLRHRAAATIARTDETATNAQQRLNTLGSKVASLTPGSFENIPLSGGWANIAGYVPAMCQIQNAGMSYLVAHIEGGTVANGTVIGTLTPGYYNTTYQHAFTVNAMTGAQASQAGFVTNPQVSQASLPALPLSDHTFPIPRFSVPDDVFNVVGTVSGTTSTWTAGSTYVFGTSGAVFEMGPTSGNQIGNIGLSDSSGNPQKLSAAATTANNNTPTITVTTGGELVLNNCDPAVTQISFSEHLPLIGS